VFVLVSVQQEHLNVNMLSGSGEEYSLQYIQGVVSRGDLVSVLYVVHGVAAARSGQS